MRKTSVAIGLFCLMSTLGLCAPNAGKVLILQDEMPQMKILAERLEKEGFKVDFVSTKEKVPELDGYKAVVVFVHGQLPEAQAKAVVRYGRGGGRVICLHHTISSAKKKTPIWLEYLGIDLPAPVRKWREGGYGWEHDVNLRLVNLARGHYVTTHKIKYQGETNYTRSDKKETIDGCAYVEFPGSEVFINHEFTDAKKKRILYGFLVKDKKLGEKTLMQDRGGWLKKEGKGWVFYFMPGHLKEDLQNPIYQQIIVNALNWDPTES